MNARCAVVLRWYLWVLMSGLLVQGIGSLILRLSPALAATTPYVVGGIFGIDFWHAWIHIVWGSVGVGVLIFRPTARAAVRLALIFGLFYTALGIAGIVFYHPFGLELDLFENAFHMTAGPATLLLGVLGASRFAHARAAMNIS
jgi:hypothetical protein